MKIVFFIPNMHIAGAERVLLNMINKIIIENPLFSITLMLVKKEGELLIEVSSAPELGLEYNSSNKTFVKSNKTEFSKIRYERNLLLAQSDYTQLEDSTYSGTKEEWKTYRQKLRDITKGVTDPDKIVFPEEPK